MISPLQLLSLFCNLLCSLGWSKTHRYLYVSASYILQAIFMMCIMLHVYSLICLPVLFLSMSQNKMQTSMYTTLKYFCIYVINHILIFTYGYLKFFFQVNFFLDKRVNNFDTQYLMMCIDRIAHTITQVQNIILGLAQQHPSLDFLVNPCFYSKSKSKCCFNFSNDRLFHQVQNFMQVKSHDFLLYKALFIKDCFKFSHLLYAPISYPLLLLRFMTYE